MSFGPSVSSWNTVRLDKSTRATFVLITVAPVKGTRLRKRALPFLNLSDIDVKHAGTYISSSIALSRHRFKQATLRKLQTRSS